MIKITKLVENIRKYKRMLNEYYSLPIKDTSSVTALASKYNISKTYLYRIIRDYERGQRPELMEEYPEDPINFNPLFDLHCIDIRLYPNGALIDGVEYNDKELKNLLKYENITSLFPNSEDGIKVCFMLDKSTKLTITYFKEEKNVLHCRSHSPSNKV